MPPILAQNDLRRAAFTADVAACRAVTGGLSVPPVCALYEARPLAFSPPSGFLPSLRVHAAVFGIIFYKFFVYLYEYFHATSFCPYNLWLLVKFSFFFDPWV